MAVRVDSDRAVSRETSRSNRFGFSPKAGCRQVFGLASDSANAACLLPTASRHVSPVLLVGVVLAYRCGAAPDSHRVPS